MQIFNLLSKFIIFAELTLLKGGEMGHPGSGILRWKLWFGTYRKLTFMRESSLGSSPTTSVFMRIVRLRASINWKTIKSVKKVLNLWFHQNFNCLFWLSIGRERLSFMHDTLCLQAFCVNAKYRSGGIYILKVHTIL